MRPTRNDSSVIRISRLALVLPAVLLDHVGELDDVLALLVLLARLESLLVLPPARSGWRESNMYRAPLKGSGRVW